MKRNQKNLPRLIIIFSSSCFTIHCRAIITALEFDPSSLLIANQLDPVAINLFPPPQQALWLYNAYSTDIEFGVISRSAEVALTRSALVVRSRRHAPLFLTFQQNYEVKCDSNGSSHYRELPFCSLYFLPLQLKIEIEFNECRSSMKIHGECTGRGSDLLESVFRFSSPGFDLISQLSPFVLHGDNLLIVLPVNGRSTEHLIGLQNNTRNCIGYV